MPQPHHSSAAVRKVLSQLGGDVRDARIVALEHRTGMVAVVRPGDPAPRLERIRRGPAGVEDRAGLMFLPLHGWPGGWLDDAPIGPGAA